MDCFHKCSLFLASLHFSIHTDDLFCDGIQREKEEACIEEDFQVESEPELSKKSFFFSCSKYTTWVKNEKDQQHYKKYTAFNLCCVVFFILYLNRDEAK